MPLPGPFEGMLTEDKLIEALDIQKVDKRLLGEILIGRGFITEEQLAQVLAKTYSLTYVDLAKIVIEDGLHGVVSADVLKKYKILPLSLNLEI